MEAGASVGCAVCHLPGLSKIMPETSLKAMDRPLHG
jgi:hypothetical protein